jgi:8-oxo-dGTP pyrophosphatase MutT (NUDIX family)
MNDAAGVLFIDALSRVLLVEPNYKPYWDLPGGKAEPGESPRDAAAREVKEELGLLLHIGRLLVVDFLPGLGYRFVFAEGDLLSREQGFQLDTTELKSWAFCTPGEQRARQVHAPILSRRVAAAVKAYNTGTTLYLESGQEIK